MSARAILVALSLSLLSGGATLNGAQPQPLILMVSPKVVAAPGYVRVSARIEPDAENRMLEVTATSDEYSRTSEIQLDGSSAPRVSVIDYANLPSGVYEVSAVLMGTRGRRAGMTRVVQVVPSPGQR